MPAAGLAHGRPLVEATTTATAAGAYAVTARGPAEPCRALRHIHRMLGR